MFIDKTFWFWREMTDVPDSGTVWGTNDMTHRTSWEFQYRFRDQFWLNYLEIISIQHSGMMENCYQSSSAFLERCSQDYMTILTPMSVIAFSSEWQDFAGRRLSAHWRGELIGWNLLSGYIIINQFTNSLSKLPESLMMNRSHRWKISRLSKVLLHNHRFDDDARNHPDSDHAQLFLFQIKHKSGLSAEAIHFRRLTVISLDSEHSWLFDGNRKSLSQLSVHWSRVLIRHIESNSREGASRSCHVNMWTKTRSEWLNPSLWSQSMIGLRKNTIERE
jgi:hypothetical protein